MVYRVVGLMSGTSLDGLDLALCEFGFSEGNWNCRIEYAETIQYDNDWKGRLSGLENSTALDYARTDAEFGHFLGRMVNNFLSGNSLHADFIASHGHTIFHQPSAGFTSQIGQGAAIAAETGMTVISGFRDLDVALGGQGAPLVPIGDDLLFGSFSACLNIGGFSNISFRKSGNRIAFDICPANIVLNALARKTGMEFDRDGLMARSGQVDTSLLRELNDLAYYHTAYPKSLGKEWVLQHVYPLLDHSGLTIEDQLATFIQHIATQLGRALSELPGGEMLVTGGGAHNLFLIERLKQQGMMDVIIPDPYLVNYKEALIFAFLGVLRYRGEINCLKSVTGACRNSSAGSIN